MMDLTASPDKWNWSVNNLKNRNGNLIIDGVVFENVIRELFYFIFHCDGFSRCLWLIWCYDAFARDPNTNLIWEQVNKINVGYWFTYRVIIDWDLTQQSQMDVWGEKSYFYLIVMRIWTELIESLLISLTPHNLFIILRFCSVTYSIWYEFPWWFWFYMKPEIIKFKTIKWHLKRIYDVWW